MSKSIFLTCILVGLAGATFAPGDGAPQQRHAAPLPAGGTWGSLPDGYGILLTRSIFAAGGKSAQNVLLPPAAPLPAQEATLVLRGIRQQGSRFTALVEDLSTGRTVPLRTGDSVAGGRVADITLHVLEYDAGGKSTRVQVGQMLSGADPPEFPAAELAMSPNSSHDRKRSR